MINIVHDFIGINGFMVLVRISVNDVMSKISINDVFVFLGVLRCVTSSAMTTLQAIYVT